ncbi:carbamoyl phosphate synthase large subunit [Tetragenococcus koreensis]|uniref:carbamoyl phosphate synthase large subunit n=1 Tax=Tetragenococcus koreensis TaxID=290335 RepID=UPI001F37E5F7|nr:carbamoyl phosphate synthase large subunit [Tetragenococcus koreensis]MCF1627090.1 carbamoyl phosphate synthase large subunit [Tetragenococcus koreensis]
MPKRRDIKKVLILGAGPTTIGQGAEFDYAGTQACTALKEEGYEVVLVNSNPATVMADKENADHVYIEPLTSDFIARILRKEQPDAILSTFGGETGLNTVRELIASGILEELNIELLGTNTSAIKQTKDHSSFIELMRNLALPIPAAQMVASVDEAIAFTKKLGYPLFVRPALTLAGAGSGICHNEIELRRLVAKGLKLSSISQCLIEQSFAGFKEIEFEVLRDTADNALAVGNIENFDPALDYVVTKIPRWPFDTLKDEQWQLNTQMKATGEVMAIGRTLEESLLKAVRSLGIKVSHIESSTLQGLTDDILIQKVIHGQGHRLYTLAESLRRGYTIEELAEMTKIDLFFLDRIAHIVELEGQLKENVSDFALLKKAKQNGFSDKKLAQLWQTREEEVRHLRQEQKIIPVFKTVDSCAGEFAAQRPYFYSSYEMENESQVTKKPSILILGAGPLRIGQGSEFDYSTVHAIKTVRQAGYEAIVINDNPSAVSTDFMIADKLYFEPLTLEEVRNVIEWEQPLGVIGQFGGQIAHHLSEALANLDIKVLGTNPAGLKQIKNPEKFTTILKELQVGSGQEQIAENTSDALTIAEKIGFPIIVRPNDLLSENDIRKIDNERDLKDCLAHMTKSPQNNSVFIDRFIAGRKGEVDVIYDGKTTLIPGIIEHIERTDVHSGDSMTVYPPQNFSKKVLKTIESYAKRLSQRLELCGIINIQFIISDEQVYMTQVFPYASRTVPFLSKITDTAMVQIAVRVILGEELSGMGCSNILPPTTTAVHIKAPVFSLTNLLAIDSELDQKMKSTGTVMGTDVNLEKALYKAFEAANLAIPAFGSVLFTIADADKPVALQLAKSFSEVGFNLIATPGTADFFAKHGLKVHRVSKISDSKEPTIIDMIEKGHIQMVVNTIKQSRKDTSYDGFKIRRKAVEQGIALFTSLDTVAAILKVIQARAFSTKEL